MINSKEIGVIIIFFLLLFNDCKHYTKNSKMVNEISSDDFAHKTSDSTRVDYLNQYILKGFIVFKVKDSDRYFVHVDGYDFEIESSDQFRFFIENKSKFIKEPKQFKLESLFAGMNPDGANFPKVTFRYIDELGRAVGYKNLMAGDIGMNLLTKIDSIVDQEHTSDNFKHKYFLHFVALIGETFIKRYPKHCHWQTELADDKTTWEPDVYYDKKSMGIGSSLYDNLFQAEDKGALLYTYKNLDFVLVTILSSNP